MGQEGVINLEWEGKIGPATIVGAVGSLGVLVAIGVTWGTTKGDIASAVKEAQEAKATTTEMNRHAIKRDEQVAAQAERLGKIETSITFIVPALARIESKLDTASAK